MIDPSKDPVDTPSRKHRPVADDGPDVENAKTKIGELGPIEFHMGGPRGRSRRAGPVETTPEKRSSEGPPKQDS